MDLGQVFTGEVVASYMVSLFSCEKTSRILEPCFGGGAFLKACKDSGYSNVDGCEIDAELFDVIKKKYPDFNLFCKDFLSYEPVSKYNGIIMNPPYIRQEKIDELEELGITKETLRKESIYNGLPTTANLYMYFLLKAIDLLYDGGELIVIFPSSWMQAKSGINFEKLLYSNTTLVKKVHINGKVFEKDALVDVVILKLIKNKDLNSDCETIYLELINEKLIEKKINFEEIKLTLEKPFSTYSNIRRGLTTGWNAMFINPDISSSKASKFIYDIISSPKSFTGFNTDTASTDTVLMVSQGDLLNEEIQQYINKHEEKLLKEKKPKTLYEKSIQSKKWYTINSVDSNGILFSYFVRNDMKFVMNTSNFLARDNFYIIYPLINKYLMFALLNNYYTYFQLEKSGKKYGAGLLKLQRYDIDNLKFIDIDKLEHDDVIKLISLSKDLIQNSDTKCINEITKILSYYTSTDYETITRAYNIIKKNRLEVS